MTSRLLVIVAVIGCHVLGLWALQSGLLRRMAETIVPVQVLAEFIEAPQPQVEPTPPQPQPRPEPPRPRPVTPRSPVPAPLPVAEAAPQTPIEMAAPVESEAPPQPAPPPVSTLPSEAPPPSPVIVPPSSSAAYLNNPPPSYPPMSFRLREQGTVRIHAYIDIHGRPSRLMILQSSGYERLDRAALQSVQDWRFVPGTRGGHPEPMWAEVPVSFRLNF